MNLGPQTSIKYQKMRNKSRHNRHDVNKSEWCACFSCLETFKPWDVREWADSGTTALCPKCGIDAVIGDSAGYDDMDDMRKLQEVYFGDGK